MNYTTLTYNTHEDVATIRLIQPHSNMQMVRELTAVCNHLEDENPASFVVIRGQNGCFNKGIDFAEFRPDQSMDIHGFNKWEKICVRIERLPKITIAILEGEVIGGGFQLALLTDYRIATQQTHFQLPEVNQGFLPGMAVFRLAKFIGLGHAKRLILFSEPITSHKAHELGIVDEITDTPDESIARIVKHAQPVFPTTIQLAKRLLGESFHDSFEDAIGHFLAAQHRCISQQPFLHTLKKDKKQS
jgi:enoyl-CoA hydratase/carnithine racemase